MSKSTAIVVAAVLLATLACSIAWSEDARSIWLSGYFLLRIRSGAAGYTLDERVVAVQQRANNLLRLDEGVPTITVRKSGKDASIYANDTLFITVTPADARANSTTTVRLANAWAQRLRTILPRAQPEKPGVGLPVQPT